MDYDEAVRHVKELLAQQERSNWEIGDTINETAPPGTESGRPLGSSDRIRTATIRAMAADLDVPAETLRQYSNVAHAWTKESRIDAPWSAHLVLMGTAYQALLKPGMSKRECETAKHQRDLAHTAPVQRLQARTLPPQKIPTAHKVAAAHTAARPVRILQSIRHTPGPIAAFSDQNFKNVHELRVTLEDVTSTMETQSLPEATTVKRWVTEIMSIRDTCDEILDVCNCTTTRNTSPVLELT